MNKKAVSRLVALAFCLTCASGAWAQDDTSAPKKPQSKAVSEAKAKAAAKKAQARAKAEAELKAKAVDINRAAKADLKKVPGITDAIADAIIAGRPYHSKADLVTKNIIPMGLYQSIRKQVAAK